MPCNILPVLPQQLGHKFDQGQTNFIDLETLTLYTKIQPQNFLRTGEEDFYVFLPYMGMAAILFNGAEPFEHIVNIPSTEGPTWNLVKISQAVSEKKTIKDTCI